MCSLPVGQWAARRRLPRLLGNIQHSVLDRWAGQSFSDCFMTAMERHGFDALPRGQGQNAIVQTLEADY